MELVPIKETLEENDGFRDKPDFEVILQMTVDFYKKVGFTPPWICYFVMKNGEWIGSAGIKGKPINQTIEIAYGTQEAYRNQGIGTAICKKLVDISLETDPSVRITARTLPDNEGSIKILQKNGFMFLDTVIDPEDGEVLEWEYVAQ